MTTEDDNRTIAPVVSLADHRAAKESEEDDEGESEELDAGTLCYACGDGEDAFVEPCT